MEIKVLGLTKDTCKDTSVKVWIRPLSVDNAQNYIP